MAALLRFITEPRFSAYFFALALLLIYGVSPLCINAFVQPNDYLFQLGLISCLAAVMVVVGFRLPIADRLIRGQRFRIPVPESAFHIALWALFIVFAAVAFSTAPDIPILSALKGGYSAEALDIQRGAFLKTRQGWQSALGYVSAVFVGTLLPYSLARLFLLRKSKAGFVGLFLFVAYAISHLQKALIIQPVTPLLYLSSRRIIWGLAGFFLLLAATFVTIYANTLLARGVQSEESIEQALARAKSGHPRDLAAEALSGRLFPPDFFSADFRPVSTKEYLVWRIAAVPIFTAADAIAVLQTKFNGEYRYGGTSSLIAAVFGLQHVNYDAEVYAIEWGTTGPGRANSVYVTDGYVNFGWPGVVIFSLLVGLGFRVFALSADEAVRSMWPLFAYNIIQASLIGSLLSAGFSLLFVIALFVRFVPGQNVGAPEARPGRV